MTRTRTSVLLTILLVVAPMAAGVSVAGTDYQAQEDGPADATAESGDVFWQGQFLGLSAGEENGSEVWAIRRVSDGNVGGLVTEVLLDENGSAVVSTDNLEGQYVVVDEQNEPVVFEGGTAQARASASEAQWEIATQRLNASFSDVAVRNDDSPESGTDLQLQSNRADYQFYLLSDELSAEELADVFPEVEVRNDRAVSARSVSDDDVFDAGFTDVEPGTYNVTVATTDGTARDQATITVSEPVEGDASLSNATVEQARGDVARLTVEFDGTDRSTVTLGSEAVGYLARFDVVDADGDGEATVAVNTFEAGLTQNESGITAVGDDEITAYQLETDPVPDQLDAATYPVGVFVGSTQTDVGSVILNERSTEGVQVWTAPDRAAPQNVEELTEVVTQSEEVAYQDWVVVQVQASGIYGYVDDRSDLNDNETGLSMSLSRAAEMNIPADEVPLDRGQLLLDEDNDQFFLVFDSNALEEGATYEANFTMTAASPYVSEEEAPDSYTANFSVVERTASFDEPVEVPASSDATISGTSSVAPGTELSVRAENSDADPFLERDTAEVDEDGNWEATLDLSDVSNGTEFTVLILEPEASTTGVVVAEDEETPEAEETTEETPEGEETETPEDEEETPEEDETETPEEDETETPEEDDETPEEDEEETPEETPEDEGEEDEDDEDEQSNVGFALTGLAALPLAGVALALRGR